LRLECDGSAGAAVSHAEHGGVSLPRRRSGPGGHEQAGHDHTLMAPRSPRPARPRRNNGSPSISLDLVLCAVRGRQLVVWLVPTGVAKGKRWALPRALLPTGAALTE